MLSMRFGFPSRYMEIFLLLYLKFYRSAYGLRHSHREIQSNGADSLLVVANPPSSV